MFRKVVDTKTYDQAVGFTIVDTLECGHTVAKKGSDGFAARRQCNQCDNLANGGTRRSYPPGEDYHIEETWDPETRMPHRVKVPKDNKEE